MVHIETQKGKVLRANQKNTKFKHSKHKFAGIEVADLETNSLGGEVPTMVFEFYI